MCVLMYNWRRRRRRRLHSPVLVRNLALVIELIWLFSCIFFCHFSSPCHSLEHTTAAAAATLRRLLLHVLRHVHVHGKELGGAAVQADALALVELALAVVGRHALGGAGLDQTGLLVTFR